MKDNNPKPELTNETLDQVAGGKKHTESKSNVMTAPPPPPPATKVPPTGA